MGTFDNFFGNITYTENDDLAYKSTLDPVLDFFYGISSFRADPAHGVDLFKRAFGADSKLALKALFYMRDIREGQGERESFRQVLKWLAVNYSDSIRHTVPLIPFYGRWDDLFVLFQTPLEDLAINTIVEGLKNPETQKLCAKWMPREGKSKDKIAKFLCTKLKMTPKKYRKMLSSLTDVVETKMSARKWDTIEYQKVPSIAFSKYYKAFFKHDKERFEKFLEAVKSGKAKINAGAIYPHTLVQKFGSASDPTAIDLQWKHLPDFVGNNSFLPVCDVSASMTGVFNGVVPIAVSIGLGIYLSERNKSAFKDMILTFSESPSFVKLTGKTLSEKILELKDINWDLNTDVVKAVEKMLELSLAHNVKDEDMPKNLLIISDMQFDKCAKGNLNSLDAIRKLYKSHGYTFPNIYFWNVSNYKNVPVTFNEYGIGLISGFSPSIMKHLLEGDLDPIKMMLEVLNSSRYGPI